MTDGFLWFGKYIIRYMMFQQVLDRNLAKTIKITTDKKSRESLFTFLQISLQIDDFFDKF